MKNSRCTAKAGSYAWFRYGNVPRELTMDRGQHCKIRSENKKCGCVWNGRHAALRTQWKFFRVGSSPTIRTKWECNSVGRVLALNRRHAGSNPAIPTTYGSIAQSAERSAVNRKAAGSSPVTLTRKLLRRCWLHRQSIAYSEGSSSAGSLRSTVAQLEDAGKITNVVIRSFSQMQDKISPDG